MSPYSSLEMPASWLKLRGYPFELSLFIDIWLGVGETDLSWELEIIHKEENRLMSHRAKKCYQVNYIKCSSRKMDKHLEKDTTKKEDFSVSAIAVPEVGTGT